MCQEEENVNPMVSITSKQDISRAVASLKMITLNKFQQVKLNWGESIQRKRPFWKLLLWQICPVCALISILKGIDNFGLAPKQKIMLKQSMKSIDMDKTEEKKTFELVNSILTPFKLLDLWLWQQGQDKNATIIWQVWVNISTSVDNYNLFIFLY